MATPDALEALRRENQQLRGAIRLLHEIANLSRESLELTPMLYAILTGVTAGVGLGFNRAMILIAEHGELRGKAAVGPQTREEADRVWKSIEAERPDLRTLYLAGLRERPSPGALDTQVQTLVLSEGDDPVIGAWRTDAVVRGRGMGTLDGLLDAATGIAAPMMGRGVLYADNRFTRREVEPIEETVFAMVADLAGHAVENARSYEEVARAARTDALTGLGHHGALQDALERAITQGAPLCVAMIDIDDFKQINDTFGHLVGDQVLTEVARRLQSAARAGSVYRYGGEEFTVLLPGASLANAQAAGERLRAAVANHPFESVPSVTCSLGIAERRDQDNATTLLEAADRALLRAKTTGKNRVQL